MIKRTICLSIIITATALAQRAAPPATMPSQHGYDSPSPADLMQLNGGSLLRASLASAPDPAKAHLASISFFSVPELEPKVIKKHDLVTIIIREESEMTSDGRSVLKKSPDLEGRVEEGGTARFKIFASRGGAQGASHRSGKISGTQTRRAEAT